MTARARIVMFVLAVFVLAPAAFRLAGAMPTFGAHPLPYGDAINEAAPKERHVTNAVTAVNFDYRGFDTLGEEFMLLAAVTGTVVLLRGSRGEGLSTEPGTVEGRAIPPRTDAAVLVSRVLAPITLVFGLYVSIHATTTPGGGFQGGVIVATSLLLVFLGETYSGWRRIVRSEWLDWCEGGGALLFALVASAPLLAGLAFATNVLPFGALKSALSGGTMFVDNIGVTFAVFGSFSLVFVEFMEETRGQKPGDDKADEDESDDGVSNREKPDRGESNDGGSK